ncbi:PorP/SprF family type IX secretion system membrane protein [Prolixibacteraceae bacterium Z1-6]|uniref:PorP/SprF family type IX secretion system membrane protein n=1 Tax=Draconibacterium aestuarii TaxID=2998507 RepID=A0A9X3J5Q0_9BACT|nr:PorP/SprF family type IX secretion system membrane protein [Prolixibacteraceae bacterium Z1-6]
MGKLAVYIFLVFILGINCVNGQDVSFSQFYSNPLYLNPAFAGSVGVPRFALQYRNQWQSFSNAFNSYSAAADFPVERLSGGLGINVINDAQANGALNSYMVSAAYAVHLRVNEKFRFHGGLQVAYNQNSLKVNDLIFADNLDINFGNHGVSGELNYLTDPNFSYVDFSTGVLVFSEKVFFGVAAHHLNEPNQSFVSGQNSDTKLNRKYTAHLGARLPVYLYGHNRKKFDISPQLILQSQGEFQQINYGMFATKRGLAAGAWFRQNFGIRYDAVIFLVGFVRKRWQFTYSYDMTVSGLGGDSGGTSEVSLVFLLREMKKGGNLPFFDKYEEEFGEM